jgi:hypothetical protein
MVAHLDARCLIELCLFKTRHAKSRMARAQHKNWKFSCWPSAGLLLQLLHDQLLSDAVHAAARLHSTHGPVLAAAFLGYHEACVLFRMQLHGLILWYVGH